MQCSHCRREIAAGLQPEAAEPRCAECQSPFANDPRRLLEDPELADDLRRARRLLRIDSPHEHEPLGLAALLADGPANTSAKSRHKRRQHKRRRADGSPIRLLGGAFTWLIVCAGGMTLTFGAGLLGCLLLPQGLLSTEALAKRDDLWNVGLLTSLAGQFLLFLGIGLRFFGRRARPKRRVAPEPRPAAVRSQSSLRALSPAAPLWSARSEAALSQSLDPVAGV
jgi:hypothetical protein